MGKMGEHRREPFLPSAHVVPDSAETPARAPLSLTPRWVLRRRSGCDHSAGRACKFLNVIDSARVLVMATLVYLLFGEMATRIAIHAPLFELRDFRHERGGKTINRAIEYDSQLGWRLKSFLNMAGLHTLDHGFRSNGASNGLVQTGGVLAVGSSFTVGSEVNDDETWPAHLEQITGWNVNNAGNGGFVADQTIMYGERLLRVIHPEVLVVDLIPDNIIGASYTAYGWAKPYYTVEHDELVAHNQPVPPHSEPGADRDRLGIKPFLGHFAAIDHFMAAFFADSWFSADGTSFTTVKNDPVDVTCRLLARLKQKTDAAHVALILYLQFAGSHIISAPREAEQSLGVGRCARNAHIATVDEYAQIRGAFEKDPASLHKYYQVEADGSTGHKSSFGNMEVAKRVAAAINDLGLSPARRPSSDSEPVETSQIRRP
jgi:hypothetical protein